MAGRLVTIAAFAEATAANAARNALDAAAGFPAFHYGDRAEREIDFVLLRKRLAEGALFDEALTREQAVRLYTINNAFLHNEEKEKGSLEVGKLGDLIVLDRDYMTCPVDAVKDIKVSATVVAGKVVYQRK